MVTEIAVTPAGVATDPRPEPVRPTDEKRIIPAQGVPSVRRPAVPMRDRRAVSVETARLYAADWRVLENWCRLRSLISLPPGATTVAAFLTDGATTLSAGGFLFSSRRPTRYWRAILIARIWLAGRVVA